MDAFAIAGKFVAAPGVRQLHAAPPAAKALSALPRIDYEDAFVMDTDAATGRTPEELAQTILGEAPLQTRAALLAGWTSLGLKVGRGDAERTVLGWDVRESTPDHVILAADSHIGMPAELLVQRRPRGLLFCTFVHHGNAAARLVWAGIEPVHVPIVRNILREARTRLA